LPPLVLTWLGLRVGEPVFVYPWKTRGCYAEYVAAQASDVTSLPATVNLDDAATLSNFIVARAILHDVPRRPNLRTLYVNGAAGGVGSAIIQMAKLEGIEVIAGANSALKCDFVRNLGASHAIDYSMGNVADKVLAFTDGRGVDLVCDQIVGPNFTDSIRMLATSGTIVSFNALGGMPAQETFAAMRANLPKSPAFAASHYIATMTTRTVSGASLARRLISSQAHRYGPLSSSESHSPQRAGRTSYSMPITS
jgi:NADPH:quinone reductase